MLGVIVRKMWRWRQWQWLVKVDGIWHASCIKCMKLILVFLTDILFFGVRLRVILHSGKYGIRMCIWSLFSCDLNCYLRGFITNGSNRWCWGIDLCSVCCEWHAVLSWRASLFYIITGQEIPRSLKTATRTARMSYGIGMAVRLGQMARIELNYCIPVLVQRGDQTNSGVQFGIGLHFL